MVFYFTSKDNHILYMGKDKYENEDLIKYAWEEDVWFHVDNYSSAHVYLRLKKEETIHNINKEWLEECCQLVRFNSIEGSKKKLVNVVYTMASNLLKREDMEVGSVSYKNSKEKIIVKNIGKEKESYKILLKSKIEKYPDLQLEKLNREKLDILERKEEYKKIKEEEKIEKEKENELKFQNKKDFDYFNNYETNDNKSKEENNENIDGEEEEEEDDDFL